MALNKQNPLMEKHLPVLHVQDLKVGGLGGGYMSSANTYYVKDINRVQYNTITNSSLTVSGSFTSGASGYYPTFATRSIINNPNGSSHNEYSYVTLPQGDYYCEVSPFFGQGAGNVLGSYKLYNKTDSSDLLHFTSKQGQATSTSDVSPLTGYFSINSSKNIDIRVAVDTIGGAPDTDNMGGTSATTADISLVYLDAKFYKIG
jgi:hypothetical protein